MNNEMIEMSVLNKKMRLSLYHALQIIFPSEFEIDKIIKRHRWGNPNYVGKLDGKPVWWNGWSANLSTIDPRYRTVYIDHVENVLPVAVRIKIFGEEFTEEISNKPSFVVVHVGGFSASLKAKVEADGFIARSMGKNIHACFITSAKIFASNTELHWAAMIARLINYQLHVIGNPS